MSSSVFSQIIVGLLQIQYYILADTEMTLISAPMCQLLPSDTSKFYRYMGSLTTPTCNQVVVWTLFEDTVKISENQVFKQLDMMLTSNLGCMLDMRYLEVKKACFTLTDKFKMRPFSMQHMNFSHQCNVILFYQSKYFFCDEFLIFTQQYLRTPSPVYLYIGKNFRQILMSSFSTTHLISMVLFSLFKVFFFTQMSAFRSLYFNHKGEPNHPMVDNYRPIQPLNGRTVSTNK